MGKLPPLFHVPLKLRRQDEYCYPKGPNYNSAKCVALCLKGSRLELNAPRHRGKSYHNEISPKALYDLEKLHLDPINVNDEHWCALYPIRRVWEFYGPWFTGAKGWLRMNSAVVGPREGREKTSFFHPRVFESALADYLTSWLKDDDMKGSHRQRWVAPVDWQPINHFPCVAASFDIYGDEQDRGDIKKCIVFPIADDFFCLLSLGVSRPLAFVGSSNVPEDNVDDWISDQPMIDLANNILNSVKLTLSSGAEAQQAKALEGLENPHLSETFAPLNWGPEGGSKVNDELLAKFIKEHEQKKGLALLRK